MKFSTTTTIAAGAALAALSVNARAADLAEAGMVPEVSVGAPEVTEVVEVKDVTDAIDSGVVDAVEGKDLPIEVTTEVTDGEVITRAGDDGVIGETERNLEEVASLPDNPEILYTMTGGAFDPAENAADQAADQAADRVIERVAASAATALADESGGA